MVDYHKKFKTKTLAIQEIVRQEKIGAELAGMLEILRKEVKRLELENDALRTACELIKEMQTRLDQMKLQIAQLEGGNELSRN